MKLFKRIMSFNLTAILIAISALFSTIANAQKHNYDITNLDKFNHSVIDTAMNSAQTKFLNYFNEEPPMIRLTYLSTENYLEHDEISINKEQPIVYMTIPGVSGGYSSYSSEVKDDSTFITKTNRNYFEDPTYYDNDLLERYFMWINIYYMIFQVDSEQPTQIPQWLMIFNTIEALDLHDSTNLTTKSNIGHLKNYFFRNYDTYWKGGFKSVPSFYLPKKDRRWSGKWKYFILNYSFDLCLSPKTDWSIVDKNAYLFHEYLLIYEFLKTKFDVNIVKEMTAHYQSENLNQLLLISFLKEKYDYEFAINELNNEFKRWIELRD